MTRRARTKRIKPAILDAAVAATLEAEIGAAFDQAIAAELADVFSPHGSGPTPIEPREAGR